jgi:6-phosphogluconolactonase
MNFSNIKPLNKRWNLIIPGDYLSTLLFCTQHFISTCKESIQDHGMCTIALSGGSTPQALFERITSLPQSKEIDWSHIHLFWSDERAVPPTHPDSNYRMAMNAGFKHMPIPKEHIHRMPAETKEDADAEQYETVLREVLQGRALDLVMLGMGEDGHTASLFPKSPALKMKNRTVVSHLANEERGWRMTFTMDMINSAKTIVLYVLGAQKQYILADALLSPTIKYPVQHVGTETHPALWIADEAAASEFLKKASAR